MLILHIDNKPVCTLTTEEIFNDTWMPKFQSEYLNWDNSVYIRNSGFFKLFIEVFPGQKELFRGKILMKGKVNFSRDDCQEIDASVRFSIYNIE